MRVGLGRLRAADAAMGVAAAPALFSRILVENRLPRRSSCLHVLGHSFAAMAVGLGFSELTIAGMLGHRMPGVTARYAHVPDSALVAAADRVSAEIEVTLDQEAMPRTTPRQPLLRAG